MAEFFVNIGQSFARVSSEFWNEFWTRPWVLDELRMIGRNIGQTFSAALVSEHWINLWVNFK